MKNGNKNDVVVGVAVGMAAGFAAGLLLAPKKGDDFISEIEATLNGINTKVGKILDQGRARMKAFSDATSKGGEIPPL